MATGWILASQILNLTNILLTFLFGIVSEFLLIYGVLVDVFLKGNRNYPRQINDQCPISKLSFRPPGDSGNRFNISLELGPAPDHWHHQIPRLLERPLRFHRRGFHWG